MNWRSNKQNVFYLGKKGFEPSVFNENTLIVHNIWDSIVLISFLLKLAVLEFKRNTFRPTQCH